MLSPTEWPPLLLAATDECVRTLEKCADLDWSTRPAEDEWTCREILDHIALGEVIYAGQIIARPQERFSTLFARINEEADIPACLDGLRISTTILATAVRDMPASDRAWHPWGGSCDASAFAAMGTLELIVHTYDITRVLDPQWQMPETYCAAVVDRLFPQAPAAECSADRLLWCTGRIALPGHGQRPNWEDEGWDGSVRRIGT
jgi:hypothetical protein